MKGTDHPPPPLTISRLQNGRNSTGGSFRERSRCPDWPAVSFFACVLQFCPTFSAGKSENSTGGRFWERGPVVQIWQPCPSLRACYRFARIFIGRIRELYRWKVFGTEKPKELHRWKVPHPFRI